MRQSHGPSLLLQAAVHRMELYAFGIANAALEIATMCLEGEISVVDEAIDLRVLLKEKDEIAIVDQCKHFVY